MTSHTHSPIVESKLVSLSLGSIMYGAYLASTGMCSCALLGGGKEKRKNYRLITMALSLFILATTEMILNLYNILDAFVYQHGPGGAEEEFEGTLLWFGMWEAVNLQIMVLLGDGILIYRCWVVFSRKLVIILLPIALWLAFAACSVLGVYLTATLHRADVMITSTQLSHVITAFLAITFATNFLTTGLIVWRIQTVSKHTSSLLALRRSSRSRLTHATYIVVESGMLYTLFVLLLLITEGMKNTASFPVSQMIPNVIGIAFNLSIIRVDKGVAVGGTYDEPTVIARATQPAVLQFTDDIASQAAEDVPVIASIRPKAVLKAATSGEHFRVLEPNSINY